MTTSLACDIVLLPSADLAQKAIAASKQLEPSGTLFTLSNQGPFPHISLYMTQLKSTDIEDASRRLAAVAASMQAFDLIAESYFQEAGYIDPSYAKTPALENLQMQVIDAINPIRDGMREKDKARLLTAEGVARSNLEQYGYRGVGELFRPHMTLTRFASDDPIDVSILPPVGLFSGQFASLALCEMGNNGTCVRKIVTFNATESNQ